MFIKGCENTNNNNFDKEAYREGWKRIFGNKHGDGVSRFPSGKGIYDEKRGVWVDSKEYLAEHNGSRILPLMLTDNPHPVEVIKRLS